MAREPRQGFTMKMRCSPRSSRRAGAGAVCGRGHAEIARLWRQADSSTDVTLRGPGIGRISLAKKTVAEAVSTFGSSLKPKLSNIAISGAPEDQLRGPLDVLFRDLAEV